ncbi:MAG: helix-turn-helix domain-containing protein [Rikenellaceae bacterium]
MANLIITTPEELRKIISEEIAKHLAPLAKSTDSRPDTITMDTAIALLGENGYPTSRGKIYKLTSNNEIPHHKYGNKLVFSRKELIKWAETQLVKVKTTQEVMSELDEAFKQRSKRK